MAISADELLIFKMRNQTQQPESASQAHPPIIEVQHLPPRESGKEMTAGQSRHAARGLKCTWHKWKGAYAMCDYCHLPFCYEDLTEANGTYYCLDDISSVPAARKETLRVDYTVGSALCSYLLISMVIVFGYYSQAPLIAIAQYAVASGFISFATNLNYAYMVVLADVFIALLAIIAALLIWGRRRNGFIMGLVVGAGSMAFFGYQYFVSQQAYIGIIALMGLLSTLVLLYTTQVYFEVEELRKGLPTLEQQIARYPNVGKF